ncbi:DUF2057 family protein [Shewanella livingstonensis]|uniref:DUF2057 domain-containing protein n=1 Tax=Shewanella livingstonensis TaxID=150120 RepID=A0A3G8LS85_9GAMM|nr:DUF2057 family protein [Shewanella livingstonensis]AZG72287.1 DUF2057 domain-containing protein [Shewanella livingstonensis]
MRSIIAFICLSVFSQLTLAASLQLPDRTETVLVNNKASQQQSSVELDLTVPNAIQQIAFRYQARYRDNGSQNNFVSDVIILRFTASAQDYQLTLPSINSASSAKQFSLKPAIKLTDESGKEIAFTQDKLIKSGLQIGRNFVHEITQYNSSGAIAAIAPSTAIIKKSLTTTSKVATISDNHSQAISSSADVFEVKPVDITQAEVSRMLDYWYQKANNQTQAEFKAKIN